ENNQSSVAEGIENKEQWDGIEFQDIASSGQKREAKVFTFYRIEEENEHEFAVKLCLEYEKKNQENLVKRELLVSQKGEFYFVKFIVNPEEDDVEPNVILDNSKETKNFKDDWDHLLEIDFRDIPEIDEAGPSLSNGKPLTREEAAREALTIDICKRFPILEEKRHVIETMAYNYKYKKILDGIVMGKIKLDGEIKKEEEEAIKKVKRKALKEKEDPEGYRGGQKSQPRNYHAEPKAEPMGALKDVLCQVGVTTIIAKFLILDMPIDRCVPILVGRGFLYTCGSILNTRDMITSSFNGVSHQTFRAAKTNLNTEESDIDDDEDKGIQRNSFRVPTYGPKSAKYLNCNDLIDRALALQEVINPFKNIYVWKKTVGFLGSLLVPLKHMEWKPYYKGNFSNKEEGDG
nr:hypothetical protein [Tanacetum cinerariifolium]